MLFSAQDSRIKQVFDFRRTWYMVKICELAENWWIFVKGITKFKLLMKNRNEQMCLKHIKGIEFH